LPTNANGVLYALGGFSGGLALYVKDGVLSYEYNLFELTNQNDRALRAILARVRACSAVRADTVSRVVPANRR
jgi:hypothetical protein